MDAIEKENPSLKGVLPKVYARGNLDPTSLGGLIDLVGNIALGDAKARSADVLGHVFEYFLGEFALAEGKKGGQFYTPRSVVQLLVEMLEPYNGRWKYGVPPTGNANYAWIQHFLYHLSPSGQTGFVLAKGALTSKSSGEGEIRKELVEARLVDCIVNMPTKLFLNTQIPASLWFLSRNKANGKYRDRTDEILFIDARNMGHLINRRSREFSEEDIRHIAGTYYNWSRSVLTHHIESNLFKREGKAITNFKTTLPAPQSDLAKETLKDVHNPIGVSEYIITNNLPDEFKYSLPDIEEIEAELSGEAES